MIAKVTGVALTLAILGFMGCQTANESLPASDAALPAAMFTYPRPSVRETPSVDPFVPFSWQALSAATAYSLQVGTASGLHDVFAVGEELPPNVTSWSVDNLLPGVYFARLYTKTSAGWGYKDIQFYALPHPTSLSQSPFYATIEQQTASVRLSTVGITNVAIPGTPLAAELALRHRSTANCLDYAFTLSKLLQQQFIYSRVVQITLDGTSFDSHAIVEYYDPFWGIWSVADPTFGVMYFDVDADLGQSAVELNQYVRAESWDLIKPKFITSNGDSYMRNYYMDPITLYLNLVPPGDTGLEATVHDPRQFFMSYSPGSANPWGTYLFGFGSNTESLVLNNPPAPPMTIDTDAMTVWSGGYSLNDNWSIVSAPTDAQAYTFRRVLF